MITSMERMDVLLAFEKVILLRYHNGARAAIDKEPLQRTSITRRLNPRTTTHKVWEIRRGR